MGKRSNNNKKDCNYRDDRNYNNNDKNRNNTETAVEEYRFFNTKDRIAERKSRGIKDTDRYCYQTAPRVQVAKHKRDDEGFFMPDVMFRPYSGTGLLCAVLGETPTHRKGQRTG